MAGLRNLALGLFSIHGITKIKETVQAFAEGARRVKPSVYLSPMAQTTSRSPARVSQIHAKGALPG